MALDGVQWYHRDPDIDDWTQFHESSISDLSDDFEPIGFGADPDELLYYDSSDGRTMLFGLNLRSDQTRTVFGHGAHDIASVRRLGKQRRLVAASYIDDRPRAHFFDPRVAYIQNLIADK